MLHRSNTSKTSLKEPTKERNVEPSEKQRQRKRQESCLASECTNVRGVFRKSRGEEGGEREGEREIGKAREKENRENREVVFFFFFSFFFPSRLARSRR